jgi:hypothetical protein
MMTPAHELMAAGLHAFPLVGKMPYGGRGFLDATDVPEDYERMRASRPEATNVGIQPGRAGLVVVDLDETKEASKVPAITRLHALAEQHGGLPRTLTVRTGSGGRHLYFRMPPDRPIGQMNGVRNPDTGRTESGVDVRGTKGYVVAPPSIHPKTGKRYEWVGGAFAWDKVADLPAWLLDFLDPPEVRVQLAAPDWTPPPSSSDRDQRRVAGMVQRAVDEIGALGEGMGRRSEIQRAAYRLAGLLWTGYPGHELRAAMLHAADQCGHLDRDTERCIDDAIADGQGCPVPLPPDSPEWEAQQAQQASVADALAAWGRVLRPTPRTDDSGEVVMMDMPAEEATAPQLAATEPSAEVLEVLERSWTQSGPGNPKSTIGNAVMVLTRDPRWSGRIRRDEMRDRITLDGSALEDEDVHEMRLWMQGVYGFCPSSQSAFEAVQVVARRDAYNPLQEWLRGLEWDGVSRVEHMLTDRFGADGSDLTRAMSTCFMVGAVARALNPGCQVDTVLILKGPQGIRKTSGFRALAGAEWFASPLINVQSKDTAIALRGRWIIEWAELDNMKRSENTAIKAFITERADTYRPPYGKVARTFPRSNVFVGTTNDSEFLTDATGDRRYWVVESCEVDVEGIERDRAQLWAEAVRLYEAGVRWWLNCEQEEEREISNARFRQVDPWQALIADWALGRAAFSVEELLVDGLDVKPGQLRHGDRLRAIKVLRILGYEEERRRGYSYSVDVGEIAPPRARVWVKR